jgi:ABC-type sulfate transport system substrate-binding protein
MALLLGALLCASRLHAAEYTLLNAAFEGGGRADNPVAVIARGVARAKAGGIARACANFHYTPAAQEIFARHGLRPDPATLARHAAGVDGRQTLPVPE